MFTQGAGGGGATVAKKAVLGGNYNNNEFAPTLPNRGNTAAQKTAGDADTKNKEKQEERHPQDKVLEYLKDGQPTEDEFCT